MSEGPTEAIPLGEAPQELVGLRSNRPISSVMDFYGVDVKQIRWPLST